MADTNVNVTEEWRLDCLSHQARPSIICLRHRVWCEYLLGLVHICYYYRVQVLKLVQLHLLIFLPVATSNALTLLVGQQRRYLASKMVIWLEQGTYYARFSVPFVTLSILTAIFQVNLGLPVFIEAKDDGGGGDNWSYKLCKAPVKSSPSTNQHPVFYRPDALPVAQPTMSDMMKGKNITFHMDMLTPSSPGVFQLCLWPPYLAAVKLGMVGHSDTGLSRLCRKRAIKQAVVVAVVAGCCI